MVIKDCIIKHINKHNMRYKIMLKFTTFTTNVTIHNFTKVLAEGNFNPVYGTAGYLEALTDDEANVVAKTKDNKNAWIIMDNGGEEVLIEVLAGDKEIIKALVEAEFAHYE